MILNVMNELRHSYSELHRLVHSMNSVSVKTVTPAIRKKWFNALDKKLVRLEKTMVELFEDYSHMRDSVNTLATLTSIPKKRTKRKS